ncbi:MAG: transglycosylase domain-containing protein [Bacteroidales bacterium]
MSKIKTTPKFWVRLFWGLFILPIAVLIILFTLISKGKLGEMPTFKELEDPENNLASQVFSEDHQLLGSFFFQNRTYVGFDDLSPNVVNALIATEDVRFRSHSGIDIRGLSRVIFKTIILGQTGSGGGSTITQQLAKNLFPRDTTTYNNKLTYYTNLGLTKFKEWVTAVNLEKNYTKDEILVMYLNTVPFGAQSFGIKSAAQTFFNRTPDSLRIEEAAVLVGVLKAPTRYSPLLNPERSQIRRNVVLTQMNKYGYLSDEVTDSLCSMPLELEFNVQNHNQGPATYFREHLRVTLNHPKPERRMYFTYQQFKEDSIRWATNPLFGWCKKHTKPDGTHYNLYSDGLRIYTTLNAKMQQYAEEAVKEHLGEDLQPAFNQEQAGRTKAPFSDLTEEEINNSMELAMRRTERYRKLRRAGRKMDEIRTIFNTPADMRIFSWEGEIDTTLTPMDSIRYYKHFLRAGFLSVNPHNGYVKAYVGGPNFKHFKFDHVVQGKRQVGSTIKPFMYTLAMQEGYSPCYKVPNVPTTFYVNDSIWKPRNSGPSDMEGKMVTLRWGLAHSSNFISAWLIKQFNPSAVVHLMEKMGVSSFIDPVPSIVLGTADITLYEMVSAYGTFSNKGVHTTPIFVTRIEDRNGNVLQEFTPSKNEIFSEETAFLMTDLLQGVVKKGTGVRLGNRYQMFNEIGGKTGTTQNHSDGWFMGITPNLVSGAWVGGEDRSIHFKNIGLGQGANMALPIWALYMQKVYNDSTLYQYASPEDKFERPINFNIPLDCNDDEEEQDMMNIENEFF